MGRPKGIVSAFAETLNVDAKTVRRAFDAANLDQAQAERDPKAALATVTKLVDNERVVSHQAIRANSNPQIGDARKRFEELKAKQLELEIAQTEGRLIDRETVTQTGARIIADARTALLSLGYRLADKIADKSDVREIARIIEAEVRDVLGVLADETKFFETLEAEALS